MHIPEIADRPNVVLITIDSLRWDASQMAEIPWLTSQMERSGARWVKTYAQGTYTLPAHIALFQGGHVPLNSLDENVPDILRYGAAKTMFRVNLNWTRDKPSHFGVPEADNLVRGFEAVGYRTIGVGGVHWFDSRFQTSESIWKRYFSEFHWQPEFSEEHDHGFERQVEYVEGLRLREEERPLFCFVNISSTHTPCRGDASLQGQVRAFEYVDGLLERLFDALPPCFSVIMADHGTLFGDDGLQHHGFYHPKVMEIPMTWFSRE